MLHRFTIDGGSVSYANRFLRTKAFAGAKDGRVGYREFATDPCRSAFQRVASLFDPGFTDNANVNVARIMGKWVALTETPMAVTFDPESLETLGVTRIPATTGGLAHPHEGNGKALSMGVHMTGRTAYRLIEDDLQQYGGGKVSRVHEPVFAGANGALKLAADMPEDYWKEVK